MLEKCHTTAAPQEAADTGFSRGLGPLPALTPGRQEGAVHRRGPSRTHGLGETGGAVGSGVPGACC